MCRHVSRGFNFKFKFKDLKQIWAASHNVEAARKPPLSSLLDICLIENVLSERINLVAGHFFANWLEDG